MIGISARCATLGGWCGDARCLRLHTPGRSAGVHVVHGRVVGGDRVLAVVGADSRGRRWSAVGFASYLDVRPRADICENGAAADSGAVGRYQRARGYFHWRANAVRHCGARYRVHGARQRGTWSHAVVRAAELDVSYAARRTTRIAQTRRSGLDAARLALRRGRARQWTAARAHAARWSDAGLA